MKSRTNALLGITAVVLGTLTVIIMAALRTDGYDHLHNAVSELGSLEAPNRWIFNIFGFILPGILISIFSFNLFKAFRSYPIKSFPFYFLFISGLFISLAGIFPADLENRKSMTTIIHLIGAQGGGIFWLFCALTLWWQLKKNKLWKNTAIISFTIPFLMILAMSLMAEDMPGLSQRIVFIAMYLFILVIAGKLFLTTNHTDSQFNEEESLNAKNVLDS